MPHIFRLAPLAVLTCALLAPVAHAEKADREKPIVINSEHVRGDDLNKVVVYSGRVNLTQGTLVLLTDKLTVTQDAEGFQTGIATGGKDGLAHFRQKKEGKDEYIEGEAERVEYDGRNDKVKLFVRAIFRSGANEARGQYIEYDGYTEQYTVDSPSSANKKSDGMTTTVIMPKKRPESSAASAPATAKP